MALKKINVSSIDFDGCLGNAKFHQVFDDRIEAEIKARCAAEGVEDLTKAAKDEITTRIMADSNADLNLLSKAVLDANIALTLHLSTKLVSEGYTDSVLIVGSNRQDLATEYSNSLGKGRCFPAFAAFQRDLSRSVRKIKFTLDKFLLGDKTKDQAGKTFRAGSKKAGITKYESDNDIGYYGDESKVTLLYAQMHRMASLNPDAEITFDFYDDRKDILQGLAGYYAKHPELLPPRMKLRLFHYDGEKELLMGEVSDNDPNKLRFIDRNYLKTVDKMIECAGHNPLAIGKIADDNPPAGSGNRPNPGDFGVLNNLKNPANTEKFKIQRNLISLNKYLDKEIARLNHWYIWRGREKANLLRTAKNNINTDAINQETYSDYKTLYSTHGLFKAIKMNRFKISEKTKVRPESTYNYLRKFRT